MNNLVIVGHPDKQSFCHNGIYKTIKTTFNDFETQKVKYIDLYDDKFHRNRNDLIDSYKEMALWADRIYFISPVWWFRLTPKMETFYDDCYAEDRDNYIDIILVGDEAAARNITHVEIPSLYF